VEQDNRQTDKHTNVAENYVGVGRNALPVGLKRLLLLLALLPAV